MQIALILELLKTLNTLHKTDSTVVALQLKTKM